MKRFLIFTLCTLMIFSSAGCKSNPDNSSVPQSSTAAAEAEVFASPVRGFNTGTAEKRTLANTYYCLTQEKQLNVVYIGGSITVGTGGTKGGWRAATAEWLADTYPEATVNATNVAIGGTSSMWGLFRTQRDVVGANPDLVFIEYAVNDSFFGLSESQSAAFMDAMVRKINTECPAADIVLVFTTNKGHLGKDTDNLVAHRNVAEYYGIPYIDVGKALIAEIEATGRDWEYYVADYSHPNNLGYQIYSDTIIDTISAMLTAAGNTTAKTEHKISETPYTTNTPQNVITMFADEIEHDDKWRFDNSADADMRYDTALIAREEGAKITIKFEGCMVGYVGYVKKNAAVKVTIDGGYEKTVNHGNSENGVEALLYDDLAPGEHTLTLEYVGPGYFTIGAILIG